MEEKIISVEQMRRSDAYTIEHFVPGRACELRDMAIDACGAAVGVLAVMMAAQGIQLRRKRLDIR